MDPGTALSIAQLMYGMTRDFYEYYRAWRHCDKDVEELRVQLLWLHDAFRVIQALLQNLDMSKDAVHLVDDALLGCNEAAAELSDILEKVKTSGSAKALLERIKAQGRKACYPFRKSTIVAISEQLETCRDALHLAVDILHLDVSARTDQQLHLLDAKLTNSLDSIDDALKQLPALQQAANSTNNMLVEIRTGMRTIKERDGLQAVLGWICLADYGQRQSDILSRHKTGTGKWFLDSTPFQSWRNGTIRTLFCPGHPGTGKTVLAAAVIDYLMREVHSSEMPVVFLFCDYKRQSDQDVEHILSALLRQIVHAASSVPEVLEDLYTFHSARSTRPSQEELETTFQSTISTLKQVYVILDGLDECGSTTRTKVLRFLRSIQDESRIQLLATSRFMPEIQEELRAEVQLEIRASDYDIKAYVESRIIELSKCVLNDAGLQEQVVVTVVRAARGMFLLARLHVDSLKAKRTTKAVKSALISLPRGSNAYDNTYEEAMKRICAQPAEDRDIALEAMGWIVFAQRQITGIELEEALAVEPHSSQVDEDAIAAIDEVLNLCAGLLTRDNHTDIIHLVHYTAHEYIFRTAQRWIPKAEASLAIKCLTYICFPHFNDGPKSSLRDVEIRLGDNPLYEYAATHWGDHFSLCESGAETADVDFDGLLGSAKAFLSNRNLVRSAIEVMQIPFAALDRIREDFPIGPHLVARFGSVQLMQWLVGNGSPSGTADSYGRTPLWWAVCRQHEALTEFLLAVCDVDATRQDAFGFPPLFHAAGLGNTAIVKMFLDNVDVDVNRRYGYGRTVLAHAAVEGRVRVVEMLLNTGRVNVNVADDRGNTPLILAAKSDHAAVVERLLGTRDAYVNAKTRNDGSALSYAAKRGLESIVQLLLRSPGIEVDMVTTHCRTALALAAFQGRAAIVKMLLQSSKCSFEARDSAGRTPTMLALAGGDEKTIELLLYAKTVQENCSLIEAKGAELKCRDLLGCSFLHLAAICNSTDGISLALANDVDLNDLDQGGWTPLHWGAYFNSCDAVRLLLQHGANRQVLDTQSWNCSRVAKFVGNLPLCASLSQSAAGLESESVNTESRGEEIRGLCDACDHHLFGTQYHCTQCPAPPGYDLCFRCIRSAHALHPEHEFETEFRYSDPVRTTNDVVEILRTSTHIAEGG